MKFKFNEFDKIEAVANGQLLEHYNSVEIISMIARYNYFVRELDFDTSRQNIKSFIDVAMPNVDMNEYAAVINRAVKNAKKYPITNIKNII